MHEVKNILSDLPPAFAEEVCEPLVTPGAVCIERIISRGQVTPEGEWYDQEQEEWVLLVSGAARILFADSGEVALNTGDHIRIPAGCRHRVTWTDPERDSIWVAVHYPPVAQP